MTSQNLSNPIQSNVNKRAQVFLFARIFYNITFTYKLKHLWSRYDRHFVGMTRYDTIRDAILTCARKPTRVGLIYREDLLYAIQTNFNQFKKCPQDHEPTDNCCQLASGFAASAVPLQR